MMALYGYARVSSHEQDCATQVEALNSAGCTVVRFESGSGTSLANRPELLTLLEFLRKGDMLLVTRIDRLARSIGDLQTIVSAIRTKGASLRTLAHPIDTGTASGKAFLDMLGVFAEFETSLRRERQLEGIAKAKLRGVYRGRPKTIRYDDIRNLRQKGMGASEISRTLNISRASVYRALAG